MKVKSSLQLANGAPVDVEISDASIQALAKQSQPKPPIPMLMNLQLPSTGGSATYALPVGTRYVSVWADNTSWVSFGTGGVTANSTDSHFCFKEQRRDFNVTEDMTHMAYFDTGGIMYVSCYE